MNDALRAAAAEALRVFLRRLLLQMGQRAGTDCEAFMRASERYGG